MDNVDKERIVFSAIDRTDEEYLPGATIVIAAVKCWQLIATQELQLQKGHDGKERWFLNGLYVLPEFRRLGIARAIIDFAIGVAQEKNLDPSFESTAEELETVVHVENDGSARALEANGFSGEFDDDEMTYLTYRRPLKLERRKS